MATAETVKAQLQADIAAANKATGKADTTMHDAVASLIEGFGGGEVLPEASGLSEFVDGVTYATNGADLTSVGEAIAEKSGVEKPVFPDGWKEAVEGIEGPTELFFSKGSGSMYTRNLVFPDTFDKEFMSNMFEQCPELETVYAKNARFGYSSQAVFQFCYKLREVVIENTWRMNHYVFRNCTALEKAVLGSVGRPVVASGIYFFAGCTQSNLTVEVYVDAATIAEIPADVISSAPWGAINATIIYRNSTTGEVITE